MNKNHENCENKIKVMVHLPDKTNDVIKQQKINRIYDLLNPKAKKTA